MVLGLLGRVLEDIVSLVADVWEGRRTESVAHGRVQPRGGGEGESWDVDLMAERCA